MKKKLLFTLMLMITAVLVAQTTQTVTIIWHFGSNPIDAAEGDPNYSNKTIEVGDTVVWEWTANTTHTVTRTGGTSSDVFNSGNMSGIGNTFSKTFNSIGTNNYQCNPHPGSMFGTITVVADGTLGVDDFKINEFSISPNPVSSKLNIELLSGFSSNLKIDVFDLLGKRILSETINNKVSSQIDVSSLNRGMYIVRVSSENASQTKRFVKQ